MRKPVISSEISPKFYGVQTTDTLPVSIISNRLRYHKDIKTSNLLKKNYWFIEN